jgi:hypothetical protein
MCCAENVKPNVEATTKEELLQKTAKVLAKAREIFRKNVLAHGVSPLPKHAEEKAETEAKK